MCSEIRPSLSLSVDLFIVIGFLLTVLVRDRTMCRGEKREILYQLLFLHLPLHLLCLFHRARFRYTATYGRRRDTVDRPHGARGDLLAVHGLFSRVEYEVDGARSDDGGEYVYSEYERERG